MKLLKITAIAFLAAALFTSCKKESDSQPDNPSFQGKWVGIYGFGIEAPSISYRFNIKPGGAIEEVNASNAVKGSGTWTLNGTTFNAHYQWKAPLLTIFTVTATYNSSTGKLTGTWGYDNSATDGGKWEMSKQ